jgi:hypothetical protein
MPIFLIKPTISTFLATNFYKQIIFEAGHVERLQKAESSLLKLITLLPCIISFNNLNSQMINTKRYHKNNNSFIIETMQL